MNYPKLLVALACILSIIMIGSVNGCGPKADTSSVQAKANFDGDPNQIPAWVKQKAAQAQSMPMKIPPKPAATGQ